jgi:hypothetical protein
MLAFVLASGVVLGGLVVTGNLPAVGEAIGSLSNEPAGETLVTWDCFWDPTINDDWHDDVLCVRGDEWERPVLLADQPFVTEDEMIAAAAEYEAALNG